ncbi:MAG: TetR/AcrR family transcriptional regulator [Burkholderiales bacterium]|nr:TetR/AcrR family transcriptional regulator [Burkholderiales bacterium]
MNPTATRPYHHGNLRQALLDATLDLAAETGLDQVSLREVARRVGVSSGAPFRHFKDRRALMTAIAEEATRQLRIRVERDQQSAQGDAMDHLKVLGRSFLEWALSHPTQFRLVSSRQLFDFESSNSLKQHFAAVRSVTLALVAQAQQAGQLPASVPGEQLGMALRASAYGLARMAVDGQLPQWGVPASAEAQTALSCLDLLVETMRIGRYPD